jgi:hypothetical protein
MIFESFNSLKIPWLGFLKEKLGKRKMRALMTSGSKKKKINSVILSIFSFRDNENEYICKNRKKTVELIINLNY